MKILNAISTIESYFKYKCKGCLITYDGRKYDVDPFRLSAPEVLSEYSVPKLEGAMVYWYCTEPKNLNAVLAKMKSIMTEAMKETK